MAGLFPSNDARDFLLHKLNPWEIDVHETSDEHFPVFAIASNLFIDIPASGYESLICLLCVHFDPS